MTDNRVDQDTAKGAIETEDHKIPGNIGLQEQLGHRDQDPMLKDADTDFPEPVAPATKRCGILHRSPNTGRPVISLLSAIHNGGTCPRLSARIPSSPTLY